MLPTQLSKRSPEELFAYADKGHWIVMLLLSMFDSNPLKELPA
jgi:hypothetical protein